MPQEQVLVLWAVKESSSRQPEGTEGQCTKKILVQTKNLKTDITIKRERRMSRMLYNNNQEYDIK